MSVRRLLLGVLLATALSSVLWAEAPAPSSEILLRARVAQLEAQLAQMSVSESSCRAQLMATQVQVANTRFAADRQAIEKQAGCALDWNAVPPACKSTPEKSAKP